MCVHLDYITLILWDFVWPCAVLCVKADMCALGLKLIRLWKHSSNSRSSCCSCINPVLLNLIFVTFMHSEKLQKTPEWPRRLPDKFGHFGELPMYTDTPLLILIVRIQENSGTTQKTSGQVWTLRWASDVYLYTSSESSHSDISFPASFIYCHISLDRKSVV